MRAEAPFNWRRGILGAILGIGVGATAYALEASSWWWLSVAIDLSLGITPKLEPPVLWWRK